MTRILMVSRDDTVDDPKLCGEYSFKTGMSMAKRCADFYNVMRGRLPGKYIASNIVYMFITGNPLPGKDSDEAKKVRGYTSAANKYSEKRYGFSVVSLSGFGARMTVDDTDKVMHAGRVYDRFAGAAEAVKGTNGIIDITRVPNTPQNAPIIARYMASQSILTNTTVIRGLDTLRYLAPQSDKADKKK